VEWSGGGRLIDGLSELVFSFDSFLGREY
jgi:hypothetical protein